jgi:hypothetical protein
VDQSNDSIELKTRMRIFSIRNLPAFSTWNEMKSNNSRYKFGVNDNERDNEARKKTKIHVFIF